MKILPFSILLTFISIGLIHCAGSKTNTKSEQPAMSTYEEYWQKVSEKEKEGLPLSGLGIVDSIYEKARAEGNGVQQKPAADAVNPRQHKRNAHQKQTNDQSNIAYIR